MIFTIFGLMVCAIGILNFKRGFLFYLTYKIILVSNINVLSVPEIPMITMDMFLSLYYLVLYIVRGKNYKGAALRYPFSRAAIWLVLSWFFSCFFSLSGFVSEFTRVINYILSDIIVIYLIWQLLEEDKDFDQLFKYFTFVFFITCIYGIFEFLTKTNPIQWYEVSLVKDASKVIDFNTYAGSLRGYRIQSFFNHTIGAGMNWVLFTIWLYSAIACYNDRKFRNVIAITTSVLCIPCIVFTNSRAPIVFMFVLCFMFVNKINKKKLILIIVAALAIGAFTPLLLQHSTIFTSIFSQDVQESIGGSTVSMRFDQLEACLEILWESPLFGLGEKFLNFVDSGMQYRLKGLESVWFQAMTMHGILGIMAYAIRAYYEVFAVPRFFKSREALILGLAYWITFSLTTLPGFLKWMYYIVMFYYIKKSDVYKGIKSGMKLNKIRQYNKQIAIPKITIKRQIY